MVLCSSGGNPLARGPGTKMLERMLVRIVGKSDIALPFGSLEFASLEIQRILDEVAFTQYPEFFAWLSSILVASTWLSPAV